MLRVFGGVSGEELLAVSTEELSDVKTLKCRLRELHGFPLCLQKLVNEGEVLEDSLQLEGSLDLQLLVIASLTAEKMTEATAELRDFAASTGQVDVAQFLLNAGVRETAAMSECLIRAAEFGHTDVALLLLDGADGEAKHTALVYACIGGHAETARKLLEARNCDDSDPSELSHALLATARHGHLETMPLFLEHDIDVSEHYDSALFAAASHGHGEVVQLLLSHGACKDTLDTRGSTGALTALMSAASQGYSSVVRVLLDVAADTSVQDSYGRTALLLASGASKTVKLSDGRAVLVSHPGTTECVRLLLEAGADKDEGDEQGRTALIEASLGNHAQIAQLLLEARADVHVQDNFGRTALLCASNCGYMDIVDLLLEAGADGEKPRRAVS